MFKEANDTWSIRDFGRGLKYKHFTQKENDEKLSSSGILENSKWSKRCISRF